MTRSKIHSVLKKVLLIVVATYLIMLLSSCKFEIVEGTVIEKHYEPSSTYTAIIPTRINGKTIMIPRTCYRSARYVLKLSCEQDDGTNIIISVFVSSEEYNEIKVGDYYTNNKGGKNNEQM